MTIQSKLKVIGLLPTSLLLGVTSYFLITAYWNYSRATRWVTNFDHSQSIKNVLAEIGKERSITALYLGTDKTRYRKTLMRQRKTTDHRLSALDGKTRTDLREGLRSARNKADDTHPNFGKVFLRAYTDRLSVPVLKHYLTLNHFDLDVRIASKISLLSQLIIARENSERERGFVAYFLSKKIPMTYNDFYRWNTYRTQSQLPDISETDPIKTEVDAIIRTKGRGIFVALSQMSSAIQIHAGQGHYTNKVLDWFTLQTRKISLLTQVEKMVSSAVKHESNAYRNRQMLLLVISGILWLISISLLVTGYIISRDVTFNIREIEGILNRIIEHTHDDEVAQASDQVPLDSIELDTLKGARQAYKFLEILLINAEKSKESALAASRATSFVLSDISHKIYTPLKNIVTLIQSHQSLQHTYTPEQTACIQAIEEHSNNLLTLVHETLDASDIRTEELETGEPPPGKTPAPSSETSPEQVHTILIAKNSLLVSRIIEEILKKSHHNITLVKPIKLLLPGFDFSVYDVIVIDKKMQPNLPKIPSQPVIITDQKIKEIIRQIRSLREET